MKAIKNIWNKHYYAICFFAFLMIYSLVVPTSLAPWKACHVSLAFHAVDFSMGFCSKILPGAIYNIFFDTVSYSQVTIYVSILLVLFFVGVCILLEKVMLSVDTQYRKSATAIFLFFLTGPLTFAPYVKQIGMLDVYWLFLTAIFLFIISHKKLYFLLIPVVMLCAVIHYSGIICYAPFLALLILYKASCTEEKKEKKTLTVTFLLSAVGAFATTLYFVIFEKKNLTYSIEEFDNILLERGVNAANIDYYNYAFYNYSEQIDNSYLSGLEETYDLSYFINLIKQQASGHQMLRDATTTELTLTVAFVFLLISPILYFLFRIFVMAIKNNKENKLKVFALTCMMILPVATLVGCFFFSTDFFRFMIHAFLPLAISFIFVLYHEGKELWAFAHKKISALPISLLLVYFAVYSLSVFDPYLL